MVFNTMASALVHCSAHFDFSYKEEISSEPTLFLLVLRLRSKWYFESKGLEQIAEIAGQSLCVSSYSSFRCHHKEGTSTDCFCTTRLKLCAYSWRHKSSQVPSQRTPTKWHLRKGGQHRQQQKKTTPRLFNFIFWTISPSSGFKPIRLSP
jgi:hypothetical protein